MHLPGVTGAALFGSASYGLELASSDFDVAIASQAGAHSKQPMETMRAKAATSPLFARAS